jgi:1,4-dihydroxy-2-naphthoyl-CoA hydrolase
MQKIWKIPATLEGLNAMGENAMPGALGIQFTEIGDDYIVATMPVNSATVQPMRLLHGGANVVLAETMGSVAGVLCLEDIEKQTIVGVEVNANHLKGVREGSYVTGTCRPVRLGRQIQVWQIDICDAQGHLSCVSRLTVAVVAKRV